jgi:hypothetical protein
MKPLGERLLIAYSTIMTIILVIVLVYLFVFAPQKMTLRELDVQRINLREPDGTLRLVISNAATEPGIIIRGQEFHHPDRKSAGMIFYNDEGTENGGLIFGGDRDKDGKEKSYGHLSFDAYEQDQSMALDSSQDGRDRYTRFEVIDYPNYSNLEELKLQESIRDLPPPQREKATKAFVDQHGRPITRLVLGRGLENGPDDSVMLGLNDGYGHPRIVMKVATDGTPSLMMFDSKGKVVGELTPKQ